MAQNDKHLSEIAEGLGLQHWDITPNCCSRLAVSVRCNNHTQLEHRQIAFSILHIFKSNFSNIAKAPEL